MNGRRVRALREYAFREWEKIHPEYRKILSFKRFFRDLKRQFKRGLLREI